MTHGQISVVCARTLHNAFILSSLRGSNVLECGDLLGGMYLAQADDLSKYWDGHDGFTRLIQSEERLTEAIQQVRLEGIETFSALGLPFSGSSMKAQSPAMMRIFRRARAYANARQSAGEPIIKPEDYLLALATEPSTGLGPRILESGIDMIRLEQAVKAA